MEIELSPEERTYLRKLLKEHLDYFRTLAGSAKCTAPSRAKAQMLEALWAKLGSSCD